MKERLLRKDSEPVAKRHYEVCGSITLLFGQRPQQGTKSRRMGGNSVRLSANPSCGWSTRPSSKGSQGQLEGSEGLPEEFVGLPERAEGLTEGSEGQTEGSLVLQRGPRAFQICLETFREA